MAIVSGYDPKPKIKSWTLWFNGLGTVATSIAMFVAALPPEVGVPLIVTQVANLILRFKTNKPVI
mgnify:CR=1 FL=1